MTISFRAGIGLRPCSFDAIAEGELRALGLNRELVIEAMVESTVAALS
jgi:hypothetical protein